MRSYKVEGIILKRSNFAETDKIVTVFTKRLGKIKVLAKGVRRIHSRRAPHLEMFNHVELVLHNGKTFDSVTEVRVIDDYPVPKADLKLSSYLFYLSEVLDKILPEHQPHPEIFVSLLSTLSNLSDLGANSQEQVKKFVVQLVWDLGYLPHGEYPKMGVTDFVEGIVEKRIKSKKFLEEI